jgi:CheY-like chemotaxis protein
MDGIETTKRIRETGYTRPIVALTASAAVGAREMMLEAGMNDYLSKPIIKKELIQILGNWIPAEKLISQTLETTPTEEAEADENNRFWEIIGQIEPLSVSTGLGRVENQRDVYEKSLKLLLQEIENSTSRLNESLFQNDLDSFRIVIHGLKGSLANVGAKGLSEKAYALELHAAKKEREFCAAHLPSFLKEFNGLGAALEEAFSSVEQNSEMGEIPVELSQILEKLLLAFEEIDLMLIDEEIRNLDALRFDRTLKAKVEHIKDMVMVMDYDEASDRIEQLLRIA